MDFHDLLRHQLERERKAREPGPVKESPKRGRPKKKAD